MKDISGRYMAFTLFCVAVAIARGFRISSLSLSWKRSGLVPIGHW